MPNMLNSGELIANINSELADNNAGLISAYDVRHNMEDIAFSINYIIASGDTSGVYPFFNAVKISDADASSPTDAAGYGDLIVESGIFFPNSAVDADKRQTSPWLGPENIDHGNLLASSLEDDDHTQYLHLDGVDVTPARGNAMRGNFALDQNWFNTSGIDNVGFQFVQTSPDAVEQEINVSGQLNFLRDNSFIPNTAKGIAKAWINLKTSGDIAPYINRPQVRDSFNISGVQRDAPGKFTITFASGTFKNNDYCAVGTANATTSNASQEDLETCTVGIIVREGDDGTALRTCTVAIKEFDGSFNDSDVVDIAFYGLSPGESSGNQPTFSLSPTYTE